MKFISLLITSAFLQASPSFAAKIPLSKCFGNLTSTDPLSSLSRIQIEVLLEQLPRGSSLDQFETEIRQYGLNIVDGIESGFFPDSTRVTQADIKPVWVIVIKASSIADPQQQYRALRYLNELKQKVFIHQVSCRYPAGPSMSGGN